MSTLRISNIEAKADSSSPTVDEQLRFTNSDGDLMLYLDGRTAGITTVGINTTNQTIKFDANNNVMVTGIITATEFHGSLAVGTSVTYGDNEKAYFGTGLDLELFHNGSNNYLDVAGNGHLYIRPKANFYIQDYTNGEVWIDGALNGGVQLYNNGLLKFATDGNGITVHGNINMATDSTLQLGVGNDFKLFHNGTTNYIRSSNGTIQIDNNVGAPNAQFIPGAGTKLYYASALKFSTETSGVNITGVCTATSFSGNLTGNATGLSGTPNISCGTIAGSTGTFSGNLNVAQNIVHTGDTDTKIEFLTNNICFDAGGSERLRITSSQTRIGSQAATDTTSYEIQLSGAANNDSILSLYNPTTNNGEGIQQGFFFKNSNDTVTEFARIESTAIETTAATAKGDLRFHTRSGSAGFSNASERLRIASDGDLTIFGSDNAELKLLCRSSSGNDIIAFQNSSGTTRGNITYDSDNNFLLFNVNQGERMRIDSDGRVVIGHTQASTNYGKLLHIHNSASAGASVHLTDSTTGTSNSDGFELVMHNQAAYLVQREPSAMIFMTNGTNERLRITSGGDTELRNTVSSITNSYSQYLKFRTTQNNGQSAVTGQIAGQGISGWGGDLVFYTKPANGSPNDTVTERLRIESDGDVVIKTNDVTFGGSGTLRINSGSTSGALNLDGGSSNHGGEINLTGGSNGGRIQFRTGQGAGQQGEKMRLDENGRLGLGDSSPDARFHLRDTGTANSNGFRFETGTSGVTAKFVIKTTDNGDESKYLRLSGHWTEVGVHNNEGFRIRNSGNNIAMYMNAGGSYAFSGSNLSDRNLKEDIETISTPTIDLIKQVSPKLFKWKNDTSKTQHGGFIAQEMQPLFPKLISGTDYDESKTDHGDPNEEQGSGNPTGLAFDYDGYTAYLTKAMQELIAKVESLEAEVAALKSS